MPELLAPEALVLVENETTIDGTYDFWADETGVRYHYPNLYRNRIAPGLPFVYYKGERRSDGARRPAEYFGVGVIGQVWRDPGQPADTPARNWRWYCAIEDYEPFAAPIPARANGVPYEAIASNRDWGVAVRRIPRDTYDAIVAAAAATPKPRTTPAASASAPDVGSISESPVRELVVARPKQAAAKASRSYRRTSRRTKEIGDWAEQFVHDWLREHLSEDERSTIDWLARRGETPGWDISYTTRDGQEIAVEVKATVSARVSVIEVTANEWQAAEQRGPEYIVAIVTGAMSPHPRIALLRDPVHTAESAGIVVAPSSYRLVWTLDQ